jgi:hypothetical protein
MDWQNPLNTSAGVHGLTVDPDNADIGYFAEQGGADNGLAIVDLSRVQRRRANPQIKIIGHVAWSDSSISQVPLRGIVGGHRYIFESDEMGSSVSAAAACAAGTPPYGFVHIVDIGDMAHPKVVSTIALQVDDPANCAEVAAQQGGATSLAYSSHYCSLDDPGDTTAIACSWFGSGLRVFDVRDPLHPREIAYYNPAPNPAGLRGAMLKPAVTQPYQDMAASNIRWRRLPDGTWSLWFQSAENGFQIVRLTNGVYPLPH